MNEPPDMPALTWHYDGSAPTYRTEYMVSIGSKPITATPVDDAGLREIFDAHPNVALTIRSRATIVDSS